MRRAGWSRLPDCIKRNSARRARTAQTPAESAAAPRPPQPRHPLCRARPPTHSGAPFFGRTSRSTARIHRTSAPSLKEAVRLCKASTHCDPTAPRTKPVVSNHETSAQNRRGLRIGASRSACALRLTAFQGAASPPLQQCTRQDGVHWRCSGSCHASCWVSLGDDNKAEKNDKSNIRYVWMECALQHDRVWST